MLTFKSIFTMVHVYSTVKLFGEETQYITDQYKHTWSQTSHSYILHILWYNLFIPFHIYTTVNCKLTSLLVVWPCALPATFVWARWWTTSSRWSCGPPPPTSPVPTPSATSPTGGSSSPAWRIWELRLCRRPPLQKADSRRLARVVATER